MCVAKTLTHEVYFVCVAKTMTHEVYFVSVAKTLTHEVYFVCVAKTLTHEVYFVCGAKTLTLMAETQTIETTVYRASTSYELQHWVETAYCQCCKMFQCCKPWSAIAYNMNFSSADTQFTVCTTLYLHDHNKIRAKWSWLLREYWHVRTAIDSYVSMLLRVS